MDSVVHLCGRRRVWRRECDIVLLFLLAALLTLASKDVNVEGGGALLADIHSTVNRLVWNIKVFYNKQYCRDFLLCFLRTFFMIFDFPKVLSSFFSFCKSLNKFCSCFLDKTCQSASSSACACTSKLLPTPLICFWTCLVLVQSPQTCRTPWS